MTTLHYLISADHPINPPDVKGDPFQAPVLEASKHELRLIDGVVHVYQDKDNMETPCFPVVDRGVFLKHMNKMFRLIVDGPL